MKMSLQCNARAEIFYGFNAHRLLPFHVENDSFIYIYLYYPIYKTPSPYKNVKGIYK